MDCLSSYVNLLGWEFIHEDVFMLKRLTIIILLLSGGHQSAGGQSQLSKRGCKESRSQNIQSADDRAKRMEKRMEGVLEALLKDV